MPCVLILAAGRGKRMLSDLPKPLQEVAGKCLLFYVITEVFEAFPQVSLGIVVGYQASQVEHYVRQHFQDKLDQIVFILQPEPSGTADAVRWGLRSDWGRKLVQDQLPLLVLPGDFPLMQAPLFEAMAAALSPGQVLRLLVTQLVQPQGYGRVIREAGRVQRIVEEKDATSEEKKIKEVACCVYLFDSKFLAKALDALSTNNAQGEWYLTDVIAQASGKLEVLGWPSEDLQGVNDLWELAQAERAMYLRCARFWLSRGVRILDPWNVRIGIEVELEPSVVLHPGVILGGKTKIGKNTVIGPYVVLHEVQVGEGCQLKVGTVAEQTVVGDHTQVGPYAHLRPETYLGSYVKVGDFVELKKTSLGERTSVAHLSYLGDAQVGRGVTVGCGFVTCNYDGQKKYETVIEDGAFIGSACQAVAPIRIGAQACVAAGSTLTEDVPSLSLAIARSRQTNKSDYVKKES
jgi:bifunctional UDP-N-acetylglucosamine pyrophosphorylase/glucosamine-1-phosphate N-acetyltransferase